MTGAYLRVKRNNEWKVIEVEHLTNKERELILKNDPRLINWLHLVCKTLVNAENTLMDISKIIHRNTMILEEILSEENNVSKMSSKEQ